MQDADITSITRELAGLVGERYVFPGQAAEISRLLESRLAGGSYAAAPDEEGLAASLTQDLQSLNGDGARRETAVEARRALAVSSPDSRVRGRGNPVC